ncbi:MAG: right-handed parallel beta-helix repeat-containing protein [bacterium]|nr:right-handed parallel beta-helix repeat-containing protein [bacterium]
MRASTLSSIVTAALLCPFARSQATWYVDVNGTPPGTGTAQDPFTSIQNAVVHGMTQDFDTIEVGPGHYVETVDFEGKSLILRGTDGPLTTILDANSNGSALTLVTGEGPETRIEGLTITGGTGTWQPGGFTNGGGVYCIGAQPTFADCIITGNIVIDFTFERGAGIFAASSNLTLVDCVIDNNLVGGGLHAENSTVSMTGCAVTSNQRIAQISEEASGVSLVDCDTTIDDCAIDANGNALDMGGGLYASGGTVEITNSSLSFNVNEFRGGAVSLTDCTATIASCTLSDNESFDYFAGGAIYVHATGVVDLTVEDTVISGNISGEGGGAFVGGGTARFRRCSFFDNVTWAWPPYQETGAGGGVAVRGAAKVKMEACVFSGNRAEGQPGWFGGRGGAVFGPATLMHCALADNSVEWPGPPALPEEGGAAFGATLLSSIIWGNTPGNLASGTVAGYSDVEGGWPGLSNIDADPIFWSRSGRDFHLRVGSPCIGAGVSGTDMGTFPFDPGYCPSGCDQIGKRYCSPGVANSTGGAGTLVVTGSDVASDDDLTLWATQLPTTPNFGYFLMGLGTTRYTPPGSAGRLCIAHALRGFLPGNNTAELGGGFGRFIGTSGPVSGAITAGSTWGFQAWYRDGAGSSNLTDAVRVRFL